jgi:photosystem II stability/assembly factor-like uncharacterized protein
MKGDFSRYTFDAAKHYNAVLMQQGRVQLDADWNEQQAIHQHRIETETKDVIGLCGVPETVGGFEIGISDRLWAITFVDNQHGWAIGDYGLILVTTDGGKTWIPQVSNTQESLVDIAIVKGAQTGWIVGSGGTILATTDGGKTWRKQNEGIQNDLYGVSFVSDRQGWAAGRGVILSTENGGKTWIQQYSNSADDLQGGIFFINAQQGWAIGRGANDNGIILTTDNGGKTWTTQNPGVPEPLRGGVFFTNAQRGWIVADKPNIATGTGTILATTNGGQTWVKQNSGVTDYLWGVFFINDQRGWVVGNSGIILTTDNGGQTWTRQTSGITDQLLDIVFVSEERGWAVGGGSLVLTTTNGGKTWSRQTQSNDITISPGRIYVDGILCENEGALYTQQPDLPEAIFPEAPGIYLAYLDVWKRHITVLDDLLIQEKALGGPDTTTRLKTVWQVKLLPLEEQGEQIKCNSNLTEWDTLTQQSTGKLNARTKPLNSDDKPCLVPPATGYQRLENQLYRIEIHRGGPLKEATFKWSRDNGSIATLITKIDGQTIIVQDTGLDDVLGLAKGQWAEVIDDIKELHGQSGQLVRIQSVEPTTNKITIATETPLNTADVNINYHAKLRRWDQAGISATQDGINVSINWLSLEGGIEVQFSEGHYKTGDYWLIPARSATGEIEWPPYQVPNAHPMPQLPLGIQHHYCRLALVTLEERGIGEVLADCRERFDDLVKLTKRQAGGCCTVVVKPEDLRNGITLQSIIDRFASRDRPNRDHITICLMPGIYPLPRSLELGSQHSNFTLEGCGDGAELQAEPGTEVNFLHGLIVLNRANYVTLRNLRFQLPIVPFVRAGGRLTPYSKIIEQNFGSEFQETLRVSVGIRPLHCALLTVQNCIFRFEVQKTINLFAVGIFAGSECWGLQLIGNRFLQDEEYLLAQEKNERRFLVGYLLSPSIISTQEQNQFAIVPSLLQDAVIRDNRFTGLTTAMLIMADTGMVRVETNTVFQCISGFWLTPIELEIWIANLETALLGLLFPLPDFFDVRKLAQKFEGNVQKIPGIDRLSLSLHASANDIDTQVTEGSQILSGPSLVVAGNKRLEPDEGPGRGNRDRPTTSSVLLTANKFRNHVSGENKNTLPGTVLISNVERCALTGNLILNESPGTVTTTGNSVISLVIQVNGNRSAISVTGNIFQGRPQLPSRSNLGTSIPAPMNTWEFLNTVIG